MFKVILNLQSAFINKYVNFYDQLLTVQIVIDLINQRNGLGT